MHGEPKTARLKFDHASQTHSRFSSLHSSKSLLWPARTVRLCIRGFSSGKGFLQTGNAAAAVIRSGLKTTFASDGACHGVTVSRKLPAGRVPANTCPRTAPGTDGRAVMLPRAQNNTMNAECRMQN
jgi:hypothetical protein